MSRRALMLTSQDPEIDALCRTIEDRRKRHNDHVEALQKKVTELAEDVRKAEEADIVLMHKRLKVLKVTVFDAKNHDVAFDHRSGVVWVESKDACRCPFCTLFNA